MKKKLTKLIPEKTVVVITKAIPGWGEISIGESGIYCYRLRQHHYIQFDGFYCWLKRSEFEPIGEL